MIARKPTAPTRRMSPILAMPTATVAKMIGGTTARISVMKPSLIGFISTAKPWIESAQQNAHSDRDQHLDIELLEGRAGGSTARPRAPPCQRLQCSPSDSPSTLIQSPCRSPALDARTIPSLVEPNVGQVLPDKMTRRNAPSFEL